MPLSEKRFGYVCIVRSCKNRSTKDKKVKFCGFPSDRKM